MLDWAAPAALGPFTSVLVALFWASAEYLNFVCEIELDLKVQES